MKGRGKETNKKKKLRTDNTIKRGCRSKNRDNWNSEGKRSKRWEENVMKKKSIKGIDGITGQGRE